MMRHGTRILALLLVVSSSRLSAQALEDNSFIVEEAYNQPARVVQHVLTAAAADGTTGLAFGQEWPVGSQKHQLSWTLVGVNDDALDLGDAFINYRYQLLGAGGGELLVAPRISALIPLGDADRRAGNGGYGFQAAVFFVTPMVNLLAESVWRHGRRIRGDGRSEGVPSHTVALGARAGIDVGKVQLVPGAAWLPAIDDVPAGVFFYLSVEHGF
jgi:hypothetical protein